MKLITILSKFNQARSGSFKKLYLQLLIISIAFILVPTLILGVWFYFTYQKSFSQGFYQENKNLVANVTTNVQQNFSMIEKDLLLLEENNLFYQYQRALQPTSSYYELINIRDVLDATRLKYSFVQSVYFYDPTQDSIFSSQTGIYNLENFYDTEWIDTAGKNSNLEYLDCRINANADIYADIKDRALYIYSPEKVITIVGTGYKEKQFAYNISVNALYDYLSALFPIADNDFYMLDRNNNIIMGNNDTKEDFTKIDFKYGANSQFVRDEHIYFTHGFNNDQFVCVVKVPDDFLHNSNKYFMKYIFIVSSILAVILIVLARFITKAIYNPLDSLITGIKKFSSKDILTSTTGVEDELASLKEIYTNLNDNKVAMQGKIDSNQNTVFYYQFKNYLTGLTSYTELKLSAENVAVSFDDVYFKFVLFSIPEDAAFYSNRENIFESINTYISDSERGICFDIFQNAFLVYITATSKDYLLKIEETMIRMLMEVFNLNIYAGSSNIFNSHDDLIEAYEQSRKAFQFVTFFGLDNVNQPYEANISNKPTDYSFIPTATSNLIKAILSNNLEICRNEINNLKDIIMETPNVNFAYEVFHQILMELSQKFNLSTQLNYNLLERLNELTSIAEMDAFSISTITSIIEHQTSHSKDSNSYTIAAQKYLQEHFAENISITDIAQALNISYPYLSKLFKDDTNLNLLDYLNNLRVDKSKDFLANTNLSLNEISEKVGYNNVQSYQRFFKKFEGITPGEYRKLSS